jgi:hypothetical protein
MGGACLALQRVLRSKPKMVSLYFRWPSRDSCYAAMVEPPIPYLDSTVPTLPARWLSYLSLSTALPLLVVSYLFDHYFLRHFLRTTIAMARKKITGDELSARAKANSHHRALYTEKTRNGLWDLAS